MHLPRPTAALGVTLVIVASAALLACGNPSATSMPRDEGTVSARRSELPVRTDSSVYHLQRQSGAYRAWVRAVYVNRTGAPIAYARCTGESTGPIFGVQRAGPDSTRTMFSDFAWACVGGVPTGTLVPGDSLTVRVPLGTVDQPRMQPPLEAAWLTGQFRVTLALCARPVTDSDDCARLPLAARASDAFEVRYAPGVAPP